MIRTLSGFVVLIILTIVFGCGGQSPTPPTMPAVVYSVNLEIAFVGHSEAMIYISTSHPASTSRVLVIKDVTGTVVADVKVPPLAFEKFGSVSVNGLKPATDYLAVMYVLWGAKDDMAYNHMIFTTKVAPASQVVDPPMFTIAPTITIVPLGTYEVIDVLVSWTFTKPGRIYIYSKKNLSDEWSADYVGARAVTGAFPMKFPRGGSPGSRWFLLQARDDADRITDSRVLAINYQ